MLEQYVAIVCGFFWGMSEVPPSKQQEDTCEEVVIASINDGKDTSMMLSIAWYESAFTRRSVSSAGAVGPMQVLPKYWCPKGRKKGCDLISAGFKAWDTYFDMEKGDELQTLCRYNSGKRCNYSRKARYYARRVLKTRDRLVETVFSHWHEQMVLENCARCPECCTVSE